jgi:ABC-type sugar transport system substrate-binding protein
MPKRSLGGLAALTLALALVVPTAMAEAQSQSSKTGLGVSRQQGGAPWTKSKNPMTRGRPN